MAWKGPSWDDGVVSSRDDLVCLPMVLGKKKRGWGGGEVDMYLDPLLLRVVTVFCMFLYCCLYMLVSE